MQKMRKTIWMNTMARIPRDLEIIMKKSTMMTVIPGAGRQHLLIVSTKCIHVLV